MRKLSLQHKKNGILFRLNSALILALFLGSALFLGCIQPAPITAFLEDPDVVDVVANSGTPRARPQIGVENENPTGKVPVLALQGGSPTAGTVTSPVKISLTGAGGYSTSETIEITNYDNPPTDMQPGTVRWYCLDNSTTALQMAGKTYIVDVAKAPFNTPVSTPLGAVYQLSVVWEIGTGANAKPYHGDIYINVVP